MVFSTSAMLRIFGRAGATPVVVVEKPHALSCFMTANKEANTARSINCIQERQHARCIALYICVRFTVQRGVLCGDVCTDSRSAGVRWSVVEREQAFAVAKTFADAHHRC